MVGRREQKNNSSFSSMIRHASPLLRYVHSLQQLKEWGRKSFLPQTCPENTHILKGVIFNNGVLQKMDWGSLAWQGFMITKDCTCFGLKAQQFSGLCPHLSEEI